MGRPWWRLGHAAGSLVVPFALLTMYMARVGNGALAKPEDTLAFGLTLLAGLLCALRALSGTKWWVRVLTSLLYLPAMTIALFVYGALYVCSAYNACL